MSRLIKGKVKSAAPKNPHCVNILVAIKDQADISQLVNKLRMSIYTPQDKYTYKRKGFANEIHSKWDASKIDIWFKPGGGRPDKVDNSSIQGYTPTFYVKE